LLSDQVLARDFQKLLIILREKRTTLSRLQEPLMKEVRLRWWADEILESKAKARDPDLNFILTFLNQRQVASTAMAELFLSLSSLGGEVDNNTPDTLCLLMSILLSCLKKSANEDFFLAYKNLSDFWLNPNKLITYKYNNDEYNGIQNLKSTDTDLRALSVPLKIVHRFDWTSEPGPMIDFKHRVLIWRDFVFNQ
jgi:hypothetical protein